MKMRQLTQIILVYKLFWKFSLAFLAFKIQLCCKIGADVKLLCNCVDKLKPT
jgi:hypothetical protein